MSPVREKFIKAIQALPYSIDKEIFNKDTNEILQDVTQKYIELYGSEDLSNTDKEWLQDLTKKGA